MIAFTPRQRNAAALIGAILLVSATQALPDAASRPAASNRAPAREWPMWGGRPDRNMVAEARGLPTEWDVKQRKNIRWIADLGTQTFGNPVAASGKVLIGTNNGRPRHPQVTGDKGVLMCFAAGDGAFLWQAVHDKLPAGDPQDWSDVGITSTPCIVGDRAWYVSNRCELICVDLNGFHDGKNDGPFTTEPRQAATDADVIWVLDMMSALKVVPLFASASAPLVVDGLVFVVTGNGADEESGQPKEPDAPSFLAVHADTGKVAWESHAPGERILNGQWSSPAYGLVNAAPQVVFPGGDGWLYAFVPRTGELLWKFNCKAHEKPAEGDEPSKDQLLATPVLHQNCILIATGQDPEQGDGDGCLRAIDATQRGDVTASGERWHIAGKDFGRSVSTVAVSDGLVYASEVGGYLNCIDFTDGRRYWRHDLKAGIWGSPVVADDHVFLANVDGDVLVFNTGRTASPPQVNTLTGTTHGSPAICDGVIYLADRSHLYAIAAR